MVLPRELRTSHLSPLQLQTNALHKCSNIGLHVLKGNSMLNENGYNVHRHSQRLTLLKLNQLVTNCLTFALVAEAGGTL